MDDIQPTTTDAELHESLHNRLAHAHTVVIESGLMPVVEIGYRIPVAHEAAEGLIDWHEDSTEMSHELRNDRSDYSRLQRALVNAIDRRPFR